MDGEYNEAKDRQAPPPESFEYSDDIHAEEPKDLKVGEHGYKYRIVDDRVMPPYITPKSYALSRQIKTKESDICFVSYPKSGTTWLSYIIVLVTGQAGASLEDSFFWLESSWTNAKRAADVEQAQAPRLFKSHMPYDMALGGKPTENLCKYIYIARNPKDVCSSYFDFESGKSWSGHYNGRWDHWLQSFADGKVHRGDWFDHVLSWWKHRSANNILFITYEDLTKNTAQVLQNIADFLGVQLNHKQLEEIKNKVTFTEMKNNEFSSMKDAKEFQKFYRKGKIGSWKTYFTVAQNEWFDAMYKARMDYSGLEFSFE